MRDAQHSLRMMARAGVLFMALWGVLWAAGGALRPGSAMALSKAPASLEVQALVDGPPALPDLGQLVQALGDDARVQVRLLGAPLREAEVLGRVLKLEPGSGSAYEAFCASAGLDPFATLDGLVIAADAPDLQHLPEATSVLIAAQLTTSLPGDGYAALSRLRDAANAALDIAAAPDVTFVLLTPMDTAQRVAFGAAFTATVSAASAGSARAQHIEVGDNLLLTRLHPTDPSRLEYLYLWSGGALWGTQAAPPAEEDARAASGRAAATLKRLTAAASVSAALPDAPAMRLVTPTDAEGSLRVSLHLIGADLRLDADLTLTDAQAQDIGKVLLGLGVAKFTPGKFLKGVGIPAPMHPLLTLLLRGLRTEQPSPNALTLTITAPLLDLLAEVDALLDASAAATCGEE
jgi:hypothetical protein